MIRERIRERIPERHPRLTTASSATFGLGPVIDKIIGTRVSAVKAPRYEVPHGGYLTALIRSYKGLELLQQHTFLQLQAESRSNDFYLAVIFEISTFLKPSGPWLP